MKAIIKLDDFEAYLFERMKDREEAEMFLKVSFRSSLQEDDPVDFLEVLDMIVSAQGNAELLAQKMDMSQETLSKILSGNQKPSWDTNIAIIKALGFEAALDTMECLYPTCTGKDTEE